jgi:hypothetical protein
MRDFIAKGGSTAHSGPGNNTSMKLTRDRELNTFQLISTAADFIANGGRHSFQYEINKGRQAFI